MARQHQDRGRGGASTGVRSGPGTGQRGGWRAIPAGSQAPGSAACGGRGLRPARRQHLKTFLHLESAPSSPTSSRASVADDDWICVDDNDASFLLSSPPPSISATDNTIMNARTRTTTTTGAADASGATANTLATAELSIRQRASCSTSVTKFTDITPPTGVCSSMTSTASSGASRPGVLRHRHSIHPLLRSQNRQLRFQEAGNLNNDVAQSSKEMEKLRGCGTGTDSAQQPALRSPSLRHRQQHSIRYRDHDLQSGQCPSSPARDHHPLQASDGTKRPMHNASRPTQASSEEPYLAVDPPAPSMSMTREQFEALPATVQRKYFSTLERLRFARDPVDASVYEPGSVHQRSVSAPRQGDTRRPPLRFGFSSDELDNAPHRRSQLSHRPARVYDSPPHTLATQHRQSTEPLTPLRRRKSVILDATDEAYLRIGKRKSQTFKPDTLSDKSSELQPAAKMFSTSDQMRNAADYNQTRESLYDSFRWLEEEDDLDLRLYLDDYHMNLREEVPVPTKNWRPSFRRHLSISKRPFGRASISLSRPATKDSNVGPMFMASPVGSAPGSPGHVRRRSRALSLMSPNKQMGRPDSPLVIDPSASHYQDPDARMKLRVYLASPHKFDEAIEFGFPSIDEVQDKENSAHSRAHSRTDANNKLRTFLEDDASSIYSEASAAEPESPRTPDTLDKHLGVRPAQVGQDRGAEAKLDYAQAPASSREMTLRMTLTRSDLRAGDEQIYGWQKHHAARRSQPRNDLPSPVPFSRDGNSKESIERQFAAMDQEDLSGDSGMVKRFWNRMRRT